MSGVWKNIPIFISSTFVDMHAERDHLRRFVFPELEERLRERRCYLEPIDLRWGVPLDATLRDERSLDLAVLRVCFQELGRSDYLVLGLLGDRYGWIPPADPLKEAAEAAGFAQIPEGRSVTELELTYAVQKFPDHVLVYVRDPLPLARMPPHALAQYSDATSDDGTAKRSLLSQLKTTLTEKLPQSVRPYRATWDERAEKLAALDAWGQQVVVDAWRMLDVRTADLAVTNADPYAEQLWELEEFTAERLRIFVGRTELIDELVGRLLHEPTGEHGQVICITGAPGSGKSALFSALRARLSTGPALVLEHAAGISKDSALPSVMRERWIHFLEIYTGLLPSVTADAAAEEPDEEQKNRHFEKLLAAAASQRRVVLLLDSLESLDSLDACQKMRWLPNPLPANVVVAVTALPGPIAASFPDNTDKKTLELPPLSADESRKIALQLLQRIGKSLEPSTLDRLMSKPGPDGGLAASSPLWLSMAISELVELDAEEFRRAQQGDEFKGSPGERIGELLRRVIDELPPEIDGLYYRVMDRVEKAHGVRATREFLNSIAVSRSGLREADLQKLLTGIVGVNWTPLSFASMRRALRGHVVQRGSDAQWTFGHEQMRRAVFSRNLAEASAIARVHRRISLLLISSRADDSMRKRQTLFHLLGSGSMDMAASYLASELGADEHQEAGRDLMQRVAQTGAGLIEDLLGQTTLDDDRRFALCRLVRDADTIVSGGGVPLKTRVAVLKMVAHALQGLGPRWQNEPPRSEQWALLVADCHSTLAEALGQMGDSEEAIAYAKSAVNIRSRSSTDASSFESAKYHRTLGNHYRWRGERDLALENYRQAVSFSRTFAATSQQKAVAERELAISLGYLFRCMAAFAAIPPTSDGELPAELIEMGAIIDALLADRPDAPDLVGDRLIWLGYTIEFYRHLNLPEKALEASVEALKTAQRFHAMQPDAAAGRSSLATALHELGSCLSDTGRDAEAIDAFGRCVAVLEQLTAIDPDNLHWRSNMFISRILQAEGLAAIKHPVEALQVFAAAVSDGAFLLQRDPGNANIPILYRRARMGRCDCLVEVGEVDTAVDEMLDTLGLSRQADGSLPETIAGRSLKEMTIVAKVSAAARNASGNGAPGGR